MTLTPLFLRGKTIVNASKHLHISVEKRDIRGSKPKDPTCCAAARALCREGAAEAYVLRSITFVNHGTKSDPAWVRYITPISLAREIVAIDRGAPFEPGEYHLSPPSPSYSRKKPTGPKKTKTKTTIKAHHVTTNIRDR